MPDRPLVLENLIIVPTFVRFVTKEVDRLVIHAADVLFRFDMLQAVCLVPAGGKDVEGDLAANGVAVVGGKRIS